MLTAAYQQSMSVLVVFGAMMLFDMVLTDYVAGPHFPSRSLVFLVENHEATKPMNFGNSRICLLASWVCFESIIVLELRWASFGPAALNACQETGFRDVALYAWV